MNEEVKTNVNQIYMNKWKEMNVYMNVNFRKCDCVGVNM